MSGFQRENDQRESSGWKWALGLGAGVIGATFAWGLYTERSYAAERHAHLKQCGAPFASAQDLLDSGALEHGDMIEFKRTHYQHWALYIGDGQVIHVNDKGKVVVDDLLKVGHGNLCRVNLLESKAEKLELRPRGSRRAIVNYAKGMVGTVLDYHLCENNCEHFVTECFYGTSFSVQQEILKRNSTVRFLGQLGAQTLPHD